MRSIYDVLAPAKLNRFLHITGLREDGYHLIESVFVLIDWFDRLHFEKTKNNQISREDLTTILPLDDLITKAARSLQKFTHHPYGVHISIEKIIPFQAGMGGGSSDAATTLLALNRLWKLNLPLHKLMSIGLELGADVPFFLQGHNAWIEGIGEKITPIIHSPTKFWILKPSQGIETKMLFSNFLLNPNPENATISDFAIKPNDFGRNDLQFIAERFCPGVSEAIKIMENLGLSGRMTGSGSAVFANVEMDFQPPSSPNTFRSRICSSLEAHPLVEWAVG